MDKKYKRVVNKLIKKNFPELQGKKIKIIEYNFTKTYGGFIPIINWIGVNKKCRNFSNKELEAFFIHELCHMSYFSKTDFFKSVLYGFLSNFSTGAIRKKIEFETDRMVIRKGYARQMFELIKRRENDTYRRDFKCYMSANQLKSYAKRIKKW